MDAAVLMAIMMRGEKRPTGSLSRAYLLLRYRVRTRLRRLEQRGLVEPGWTVTLSRRVTVDVRATPEGVRTARVAAVVLELEDFAGPVGAVIGR